MPPLFATYNPHRAGGVIANAKPRVYPYPAAPTYTAHASGARLGPQERGNFFLRQNAPAQPMGAVNTSTPDTSNSSGGCGCGGGGCSGAAK